MGRETDRRPDWQDGAPYRALIGIDRAGLAWEWLRRDPDYIAFCHDAGFAPAGFSRGIPLLPASARAENWGLHFRRTA